MKEPTNRPIRHFPYQHPTFGTKNRPTSERSWKRSVYYWWWAYLKRSHEYLACCEAGGKGKLATLYKDFGDVRGDDFKAWWREGDRGATLFAEPAVEVSVRILNKGDAITDPAKGLSVYLPLNLPNGFLVKRVKDLLNAIRKGKRGVQYGRADKSNAKYKFEPPRVYRRAKLSENWPLWNRHKRRRPRSRIPLSSANVRCGWRWNTAMSIRAKLRR